MKDIVNINLNYEQTGEESQIVSVMIKRLRTWAMDRRQKVRTDGSERV